MKKVTLVLILFIFVNLLINAQPAKRASCYNYLKFGELDKAKQACDECIENDKTKSDALAWWYRGQVYQAIYVSQDANYKKLDPNAADVAFFSYKKALLYNFKDPAYHSLEFDNKNKPEDKMQFAKLLNDQSTKYTSSELFVDIIMERYPFLANILVNQGVKQYKDLQDYPKALKSFENSLFVSQMSGKIDTPIVYYAALAAEKSNDLNTAKEYYQILTKLGYGADNKEKATIYYLYANIYLQQKDTANYIKTLNKGIDKYPDEPLLLAQKINWYIDQGKSQEAKDIIIRTIKTDPENKLLHFNLGTIYEGKNNRDSAIICYKKSLEIDSNYLSANYNLGALYNNWAKDKYDALQDLPIGKEYDNAIKDYDETLKMAKPYLEKAFELDPEDLSTIQSLKIIYYKTGETDKYNKMNELLKSKTK
ncbi:MAG: tetratricopeptide repeat protein [Bacteroidota bacterium]